MITLSKLIRGISRGIPVKGDDISFLTSPGQFRDTLLSLASTVQHRARISSLYIGTGEAEQAVVASLVTAVRCRGVDVGLVLDRYRGTRDGRVLAELRHLVPVHLYQTPTLRNTGYYKPGLLGELLGVHHFKYYLFDDTVILSGANLGEVYFGERRDRYVVVRSRELADYISEVHSLHTQPAKVWDTSSYQKSGWSVEGVRAAGKTADLMTHSQPQIQGVRGADTLLYPLYQIPWCRIHQIQDMLELLLTTASPVDLVTLSSGYFNPSSRFCDVIAQSPAQVHIIVPSPACNGFYKGAGVKSVVPGLYNLAARRTLRRCSNVTIHEYGREGWCYHAKGVWAGNMTLLGSSNFNRRSELRDSEFSVAMVTDNDSLKKVIRTELEELYEYTAVFNPSYRALNRLLLPLMSRFL